MVMAFRSYECLIDYELPLTADAEDATFIAIGVRNCDGNPPYIFFKTTKSTFTVVYRYTYTVHLYNIYKVASGYQLYTLSRMCIRFPSTSTLLVGKRCQDYPFPCNAFGLKRLVC